MADNQQKLKDYMLEIGQKIVDGEMSTADMNRLWMIAVHGEGLGRALIDLPSNLGVAGKLYYSNCVDIINGNGEIPESKKQEVTQ